MAPTESDILKSYLLLPAPLPAIITFDQFKLHFPPRLHGSPLLKSLFRDLQAQKNSAIDAVRGDIDREVARGSEMRREMARAARQSLEQDGDDGGRGESEDGEVEMERALFGDKSGARSRKHDIRSIIPDLDGAAAALENEIVRLNAEEEELKGELRQIVGGLSDLRYGKFANPRVKDEITDGLVSLQEACEGKS